MSTRRERKIVTVLFADLVGFTSRAESLDPEDVEAILGPYHEQLRSELERFGGTVEKFIGDAVMALFGAPLAHEDDPERAVRAALAISEWAEEEGELEVRIGITTGEALVSLDARPETGQGMASGDVVNTAARLQAAAPVNGILVDETTYRSTERAIVFEKTDPVEAKGKRDLVVVWKPLEARARFGADLEAPRTPLVGRERERELLTATLERVKNERTVQLLTLVGVPGIGKSRMVAELFRVISDSPELVTWRQGRSLPYGEGVTYWALGEMIKNQAGILETDDSTKAGQKLHDEVARLFGDDRETGSVETKLRSLVGIETAAAQTDDTRQESFYAWRRFFEELAERRPAVLVFEDLHWADTDLLDFIDHLVDWAEDIPLLCVCTARPELFDRRPGWGGGKPNASTISLSPLSDEETAKLLMALLERTVLPAEQQAALLRRAGGNPLYAEQFARMLVEHGDADELPIPETVQGIIAARLDGLDPEEKALLQDAAVVGKVFWSGPLIRMNGRNRSGVEQMLHALTRKEFVRGQRRSSVEGESEYAFLHLLVPDVAYSQIPRAARLAKHRAVAEWMASLGRAEEHAEVVAHHYLRAIDFGRAVGAVDPELEESARHALRSAGDRALALNAFSSAARFYRRALDLWPRDDPERAYVLFGLGVAGYWAEEATTELEEARDELMRQGNWEKGAEAEAMAALSGGGKVGTKSSLARLQQAFELVRERPLSRSKAFVLTQLAYRAASVRAPGWEQYAQEALAMAEGLGAEDLRATVLTAMGTAQAGGIESLEKAVEIADAIGSMESIRARINLAAQFQTTGELQRCFDLHARARSYARRFGGRDWLRHLRSEFVLESYWRGRWDESMEEADAFLDEVDAGNPHPVGEMFCRSVRAQIRLARGDTPNAIVDGEKAVDVARDWTVWGFLVVTLAGLARILLAAGRIDEADALVTEAIGMGLRDVTYAAPDLATALVDLGRRGELGSAIEASPPCLWLDAAKALVAGNCIDAAELYAEIGSVPYEADARLRSGRADQVLRALDFYRSVGATRYIREGEALLAATA